MKALSEKGVICWITRRINRDADLDDDSITVGSPLCPSVFTVMMDGRGCANEVSKNDGWLGKDVRREYGS
jgi:hypothetical protein